jgi:hypothetical protein
MKKVKNDLAWYINIRTKNSPFTALASGMRVDSTVDLYYEELTTLA